MRLLPVLAVACWSLAVLVSPGLTYGVTAKAENPAAEPVASAVLWK